MKRLLSTILLVLSFHVFYAQFCTIPAAQCSNVSITNVTTNSLRVTWTKGSGNYSIVILKPAINGTVVPSSANLDIYTASAAYGGGSNLGNANYVVYMGTGNLVNITGLGANINFEAMVYSYNIYNNPFGADSYCLKTTLSSTNIDKQYTLANEPTIAPTMVLVGTPGTTTATLNLSGSGYNWALMSTRESGTTSYLPIDGTTYGPASPIFGNGQEVGGVGSDNYSTYFNSPTATVNLSNLKPATGYYARAYACNGTGSGGNYSYNYYTGSYASVYFSTYNYAPAMNAVSNMSICQNAATQTIPLTGITDGSALETQSIYLYASSSNTTLIQNVTVNYTTPASTGNIQFTPTSGQYGTSVITLSLYDSGPNNYYTIYTFTVTVLPPPGPAPQPVTASTTICQLKNGVTFSVSPIANATGYVWNVPGGTIVGGNNTNNITVNFNTAATSTVISVYGTNSNGCGNGASKSLIVNFDKLPTVSNAGPNQQICNNLTAMAANTPVTGTGAWTYCSSGLGNLSSTVAPNTNLQVVNNQTVTSVWTISNGVCPSSSSTVVVTNINGSPSCTPYADFVADNTQVCQNSTVTFSNTSVAAVGANTYTWTFGAGASPATLISTAAAVTVTYNTTGPKTVTLAMNSGAGALTMTKNSYINVITTPAAPANVFGNNTVCQGKTGESYFINTVADATDYTWSFPTGVLQNTGGNTNAITANFSSTAASGNVGVYASNMCGNSLVTNLAITVNPLPSLASSISGNATVCQGQNGVVYVANNLNNGLSYTWSLPNGANIVGGLNTRTITVNFDNTATSGTISVYGTNGCGDGDEQSLNVTVNPLPDAAGSITGSTSNLICPLSTGINYSIAPVANATSYAWVHPSGYTITGGAGTNSIMLDASLNAANGIIKAVALNACGHGDTSSVLNVNITSLPVQQLCVVTVDTLSTHNEVIWQKNGASNVDSFRVYRVQTSSLDTLIATVGFNELSSVVDVNSNPNVTSYTYKVAAVDFCGNEGPKSGEHQTIHLQSIFSPSPAKMDLSWNLYSGATVSNYRVLRDTAYSGNWLVLINNLAPNATSYTDFSIPTNATSVQYRVDVIWANSCDPTQRVAASVINTTKSNTKDYVKGVVTDVKQADILNSINLYPNPTKDVFEVEIQSALDHVEIEIYNQLGSLVKTAEMNYTDKASVNISDLSSGMYFITVKTQFGSVTKRISKL